MTRPYRTYRDRQIYTTKTPSVFWITNGWNDFQGNMAAGAGMCGVCYWQVASVYQRRLARREMGVLRVRAEVPSDPCAA